MVPAGYRVAISPWGYGMAALGWHLMHTPLHIPVRTIYASTQGASFVGPHTHPLQKVFDGGTTCHIEALLAILHVPAPSKAAITQAK